MNCCMPKGTSQDEAASNRDKIKPVALAIVELCLFEGIMQASRQLVSQQKISLNNLFKIFLQQSIGRIQGHMGHFRLKVM